MIGYLFTVSFVGLFSITGMRNLMIIKRKLTYPSGTATAHLINSFHTPQGAKQAKKQVALLFKTFCGSFTWCFFQWFFAASDGCGFASFPTFGLKAYRQRFYFDFWPTYVGVGMISGYLVNISMLVGAVISWGIMWPLIEKKKGVWYGAHLSASSLHGIQGYRVFISIGMILGDGLFHVMMSIVSTASDLMQDFKTGYLTLSSPRSMFFSQVFGTAIGCVISPVIFWFFYKAYRVGDPTSSYPAPYGLMYRSIALLGVEGFSSLPKHCVALAVSFFALAIAINIVTILLEKYETKYEIHRFVPNAMAMAVPFYLGSYFVVDMCLGSLLFLFLWKRWKNNRLRTLHQRLHLVSSVASLCGVFRLRFYL